MTDPHVLDHSDTGDLVVAISRCERPIVSDRNLATVGESGLFDALLGQRRLILAQRDTCRIHTVMLRRVHYETAPSAAYVEQPFSRLEAQLAADQIELRFLRDIERVVRRAEIGAGINHSLVEPELVETVADVIMKMDRRR